MPHLVESKQILINIITFTLLHILIKDKPFFNYFFFENQIQTNYSYDIYLVLWD